MGKWLGVTESGRGWVKFLENGRGSSELVGATSKVLGVVKIWENGRGVIESDRVVKFVKIVGGSSKVVGGHQKWYGSKFGKMLWGHRKW